MNRRARRSLFAIGVSLAFAAMGRAQTVRTIDNLDAPIHPGSSITYRKLVTNVFKGLSEDAAGQLTTAKEKVFRQIGVKDRTVLPAGSPLVSFEALRVRGDGRNYVALLVEAESDETGIPGGGAAVLAVFSEGSSEALDVADVKVDVFCSFGELPSIAIGPDDAFLVLNSHSNSSEGYLITTLLHVHGGRLHRIDSIFTLTARSTCGRSFTETLTWNVEKGADSVYPKITANVALDPAEEPDNDCDEAAPRLKKQKFRQTYRFNKASSRYEAAGGDIQTLEKFNKENL